MMPSKKTRFISVWILTVVFLFSLLIVPKSKAQAEVSVDFNLFYGQLSPYGNWVTDPSLGLVWYPSHPRAHWRPYLDGRWAWTDDGWAWVSYEPWGWATYHYGRWAYDPDYGWVWAPGSVWAPAWVAWYQAPDYIGWSPLGVSAELQIDPNLAIFVSAGSFLSPNLYFVAADPLDNDDIFHHHHFRHFDNIAEVDGRVVDPGPGVAAVERMTGRRVERFSIASRNVDPSRIRKMGWRVDNLHGRNFYAYRPHVSAGRARTPFLRNEAARGAIVRNRAGVSAPRVTRSHQGPNPGYRSSNGMRPSGRTSRIQQAPHANFRTTPSANHVQWHPNASPRNANSSAQQRGQLGRPGGNRVQGAPAYNAPRTFSHGGGNPRNGGGYQGGGSPSMRTSGSHQGGGGPMNGGFRQGGNPGGGGPRNGGGHQGGSPSGGGGQPAGGGHQGGGHQKDHGQ